MVHDKQTQILEVHNIAAMKPCIMVCGQIKGYHQQGPIQKGSLGSGDPLQSVSDSKVSTLIILQVLYSYRYS